MQDFRLIIDSIPALVFTTTATGELEWVNRPLLDYFQRSLADLQAWQMTDVIHPEDLPNTMDRWQRGVASGAPYGFEQRLRRWDDVYRWFHFRAVPLRDAEGNLTRWYGTVSDIDDIRSMQARFSRAAQLATVSQLAASIAHEINQPLAAIVANAHACQQWLSSTPPNVGRARLSADRIVRDGNAGAQAVARIRSLFRHAPPVKQLLNLNEVIHEVCAIISDDVQSRLVALRMELQQDLPPTRADRVQIQLVIANLARNAIEAMDDVEERARELSISTRALGNETTAVYVRDCGVGLPQSDEAFDPFYTTKASGMGIGLAICRSIIDAHGGRLWATPNVPHGTTFSFILPNGNS